MTQEGRAIAKAKWQVNLPALPCRINILAHKQEDTLGKSDQQPASDTDLVRFTLGGDKRAYEALVRRYQKLVYNVVYQLCQKHETAADLTQETFLRAYRALSSFDQSLKLKPWLLRIATNLSLNTLRDNREHVSLEFMLEEHPEYEPAANSNVELEVELKLSQTMLMEALEKLPLRHRTAFLLRYQHDLSYADIAYTLKEPETTIKALLYRIRETLRKKLLRDLAQEYSSGKQQEHN